MQENFPDVYKDNDEDSCLSWFVGFLAVGFSPKHAMQLVCGENIPESKKLLQKLPKKLRAFEFYGVDSVCSVKTFVDYPKGFINVTPLGQLKQLSEYTKDPLNKTFGALEYVPDYQTVVSFKYKNAKH